MTIVQEEPVTTASVVTAALVATVNVAALLFSWDGTVVAAVNLAIGAWVLCIAFLVRRKVTPNVRVALTTDDETALLAAGFNPPPMPVNPPE